jgi:hypothetical protein
MVKNIPTICIDGQITFVSRIPPQEELLAAIQKRINEKLKLKIRARRGEIFILGKTSDECESMRPAINQAILELGMDIDVSYVTGEQEVLAWGATRTPAVVVATYRIKSQGGNLQVPVIKEWLKDI